MNKRRQRRRHQQLAILTRNILKLRYIKDDAERYGSKRIMLEDERLKLELLEGKHRKLDSKIKRYQSRHGHGRGYLIN